MSLPDLQNERFELVDAEKETAARPRAECEAMGTFIWQRNKGRAA